MRAPRLHSSCRCQQPSLVHALRTVTHLFSPRPLLTSLVLDRPLPTHLPSPRQVDTVTGEIAGVFESIQPSDDDMGSKAPKDVKVTGLWYAQFSPK